MNNKAQFTPGPWFANQSEMEAHSCKVEIRTTNGAYLICSDAGYQNAPLIAAAPAMYEALQSILDSENSTLGDGGSILGSDYRSLLQTALAQAEGKHD